MSQCKRSSEHSRLTEADVSGYPTDQFKHRPKKILLQLWHKNFFLIKWFGLGKMHIKSTNIAVENFFRKEQRSDLSTLLFGHVTANIKIFSAAKCAVTYVVQGSRRK